MTRQSRRTPTKYPWLHDSKLHDECYQKWRCSVLKQNGKIFLASLRKSGKHIEKRNILISTITKPSPKYVPSCICTEQKHKYKSFLQSFLPRGRPQKNTVKSFHKHTKEWPHQFCNQIQILGTLCRVPIERYILFLINQYKVHLQFWDNLKVW